MRVPAPLAPSASRVPYEALCAGNPVRAYLNTGVPTPGLGWYLHSGRELRGVVHESGRDSLLVTRHGYGREVAVPLGFIDSLRVLTSANVRPLPVAVAASAVAGVAGFGAGFVLGFPVGFYFFSPVTGFTGAVYGATRLGQSAFIATRYADVYTAVDLAARAPALSIACADAEAIAADAARADRKFRRTTAAVTVGTGLVLLYVFLN